MSKKILILGINGFIGSSLTEHILQKKDWEIYGMDLATDKIADFLQHERLHFTKGDITVDTKWIEDHIQKCDAVLPLVAIATPSTYVQNPLRIFELDFEANLAVVRLCVKHKTRVIFPSTSEVYGMCEDEEFDEEISNFVQGPVNKPRWIYSCCKQLMDRIIHAYGERDNLPYTLFRPFNWLGPKLDNILETRAGGSRVITQFIGNILRGEDIQLVNGGAQQRSFTYIDDGTDLLLRVIENQNSCADKRIFNVGNPANNISIRELAELLIAQIKTYPKYASLAEKTKLISVSSDSYYGAGYQDVSRRVPSIKNAEKYLGWKPTTDTKTALKKTLDYHLAK
jgi:nucleoside-diphosphate-sugar epimerase